MASIFVVPSSLAINGLVYFEECINKQVIPFIKEYHSDGNYVFNFNFDSLIQRYKANMFMFYSFDI